MAIITVPGGQKYDTVRRVFIDEPIEESSSGNRNNPPLTPVPEPVFRRSGSNSAWGRMNDIIIGIGDWFDYNASSFPNNIPVVFYIFAWIALGLGVIAQWISAGFWAALITGIIGGVIVYYAAEIATVILMYVSWGFFRILRYIFYNVYTLLLAIAIIAAVTFSNRTDRSPNRTATVSTPVSYQPNYYCDVNTTLNVREQPHPNARLAGQLKRNEEVYVYSIDNNFAKIDFKGRIAYVSAGYLKPKAAAKPGQAAINGLIGTKFAGYDGERAIQDKLGFWCGTTHVCSDKKFILERWENQKEQKLWLVLVEKISNNESVIRDILSFERKSVGDIGSFQVYNNNTKQWSDYMMVQISTDNKLNKIYDADSQTGKISAKNPESYWGKVLTEWESY
ncbi:MAG: SH3 domain-containing protein [Tannerella sp.]|jgi:hypothetical protein|nr:SH3 domain-containing protein [Tannerella sp.]